MVGEVYCEICLSWIKGPVYWREDVLSCRECAKDVNAVVRGTNYPKGLFFIILACVMFLLAFALPMPFSLFYVIGGTGIISLVVGGSYIISR